MKKAAVSRAQAPGLCGHSHRGRPSSQPHQLPPDGKACANLTFSPKLLYSCGLTQGQEKGNCCVKKSASQKGRQRGTVNQVDLVKISPCTGNTQHPPFGPSQRLTSSPPRNKGVWSGEQLVGSERGFHPAIGGIKKGSPNSPKTYPATCQRVCPPGGHCFGM